MSIMPVIYIHNKDKCANNKVSRWKEDGTGMGLRVQV